MLEAFSNATGTEVPDWEAIPADGRTTFIPFLAGMSTGLCARCVHDKVVTRTRTHTHRFAAHRFTFCLLCRKLEKRLVCTTTSLRVVPVLGRGKELVIK